MLTFLDHFNGLVYPVHQLGNVTFRAWQACCTTIILAFFTFIIISVWENKVKLLNISQECIPVVEQSL
jgi:hypothetical protein